MTREDRCGLYAPPKCEADGQITRSPGVALTVFTGDCVPILLHDPVTSAIGAVHAGWRGTAADAVGAAVRKMMEEYGCTPGDIRAAIGPSISKCCYETDNDVAEALRNMLGEAAENCLTVQGKKYMTDLKKANHLLLSRAGVQNISISEECTSCQSDKYWSHRKTKGQRGSQAAIIVID